jgi:hypothetical protein
MSVGDDISDTLWRRLWRTADCVFGYVGNNKAGKRIAEHKRLISDDTQLRGGLTGHIRKPATVERLLADDIKRSRKANRSQTPVPQESAGDDSLDSRDTRGN